MEADQQEEQSTSNGNSGNGNDNDNNDNNTQNNEPSKTSPFNDDRCPGRLGSQEPVDVEEFQFYSVIVKFREVPPEKVAKVLKAYSFECITKVPGLTFYQTNENTLPTPSPVSTKELFQSCNVRYREFFNTNLSQQKITIYYKVKCSVPVTELRHQVFQFLQDKHVWINSKQIHDNRPMDAAVIYRAHNTLSNKHVLYVKIKKAMKMLETEQGVTEEQQIVLTELLRENHFGWTIMSKRHTYTDGHHPKVYTNGLIIVVKKPFLQKAQEIFALIQLRHPQCLGGGMQILATGSGNIHGYEGYKAMTIRNNDYHNNTDCVTNQVYHPEHRELVIQWAEILPRKTYKHL